jgi:hypothetical protein
MSDQSSENPFSTPSSEVPAVSNRMPGEDDTAGGSGGDPLGDDEPETLGARGTDAGNPASKDPSDWVTGDEPMTAAQKSYLDTLAREAGEELPADLTKAQASEHIDRLQQKTGRGR